MTRQEAKEFRLDSTRTEWQTNTLFDKIWRAVTQALDLKKAPYPQHQLSLTNNYDLLYVGAIQVGTPLQSLTLTWDNGSGIAVLEGENCTNCY